MKRSSVILLSKTFGIICLLLLVLYFSFNQLSYPTKVQIAQVPLNVGTDIPEGFAEAIVVLGGGCNPGRATEERLNVASALYQKKRRIVLVSEGSCFLHERIEFTERMVSRWKIKQEDIIWDSLSLSTVDNIENSQEILNSLGIEDAILCTSQYHQLRSWLICVKLWRGKFKLAAMPDSMLELEKEQVYRNKRGGEIKQEYLKTLHHLIYLW